MGDRYIPLSAPNLKGNELKYVTEAVETEWVSTGGPYVNEFESKISQYVGAAGAVTCQSGTAGLHISLMLMGVTDEDAVLVPTLTFIASVNPVHYIGAEPIFMDCDESLCMDPKKMLDFCENECDFIEDKLIERVGKKHIKAMIVVHVFGNMADMEAILEIAEHYNIKVIEDAAEALGTYYTEGKYVGRYAGTLGDIGVYSFNGNKIITTGGGGIIVSNHKDYLAHARHLTTQAKSDELYYTHDEIGYNYRMTNLQAALGIAQLERLEDFILIKEKNYRAYKKAIKNIEGLNLLDVRKGIRSNRWFYAAACTKCYHRTRDEVIRYMAENQIQTRPIWGLIHEQIPYRNSRAYKIKVAKDYWECVVNIPCSTNLSEEDRTRVAKLLSI